MFMQYVRLSLIALSAISVAGCAGVRSSVDQDQIQSLRYTETVVSFAPEASIWWGDGERAYAASKGRPSTDSEELGKTPEGRAYLRAQITSKIKAAMGRHVAGVLKGSRPARVEVVVKDVRIASAVQRVLIGGSYTVVGEVKLVNVQTGAVIDSRPIAAAAVAGQGVVQVIAENALAGADPIDRVIDNFAQNYRLRLLPIAGRTDTTN